MLLQPAIFLNTLKRVVFRTLYYRIRFLTFDGRINRLGLFIDDKNSCKNSQIRIYLQISTVVLGHQ